MVFTYFFGILFVTGLTANGVSSVTPCFSCPSDVIGVITQWNNIISATGEDEGECIPCTICDNNAYKRRCTKCSDAVCMEPEEVALEFYMATFGYLIFSLAVAYFYMCHFHDINNILHTNHV